MEKQDLDAASKALPSRVGPRRTPFVPEDEIHSERWPISETEEIEYNSQWNLRAI